MEESRQEERTGKKQTRARLCEERKDFRFWPIDLYKSQTMGGGGGPGGGWGARGLLKTSVHTYKTT